MARLHQNTKIQESITGKINDKMNRFVMWMTCCIGKKKSSQDKEYTNVSHSNALINAISMLANAVCKNQQQSVNDSDQGHNQCNKKTYRKLT